MENPCYKCGQPVEEGVPFCLHCSAPQIRVLVAEPTPAAEKAVAMSQDGLALPAAQPLPGAALPLRWSQTIQPCVLAAMVATGLMALGLNPFVAMISVGFLAVVFYRQRRPGTVVQAKAGVKLGALSGLLWFGMASILEALVEIFFHKGAELRTQLIERIQQTAAQTSDPQALAVFDRLKTSDGLAFLMIFGLFFAFFAAIVLGGIGGALGGAILGRKDKP